MNNKSLQSFVFGLFFLSGVSALMYQVIWMRVLALSFGSTVQATTTVLAAFMAGLAGGSYLLGRWVDGRASPLRLYLLLEVGIAVFGAASPLIFSVAEDVYAPLYNMFFDVPWLFSLLRFLLLFVVVAFGAALMGGTLPVLAAWLVSEGEEAGRKTGMLYGVNTCGALVGVVLCSFFLVPFYGVSVALTVAVALNGLIAIMVLLVSPVFNEVVGRWNERQKQAALKVAAPHLPAVWFIAVLLAFGLSGFAALGYEVVWTRVLAQIIGSSIYAFATMLLTFLFGLMLGSLIMSRYLLWRARGSELVWFVGIQFLIAMLVLLLVPLIGQLPRGFLWLIAQLPHSFAGQQLVQVLMTLPVMLLPTLLLGALFPLACQLYVGARVGADVGRLYAVNTGGAVLGAVVTGFVLLPWIGSESTLRSLAGVNAVVGLGLLLLLPVRPVRMAMIGAMSVFVFTVAVLFAPAWNALLMNSNFPNLLRVIADKPDLLERHLANEVVYSGEDASARVLVYRAPDGSLNLNVNGHAEGGYHRADMSVQVELATLPTLLHRNPEKVLLVGLGPGVTLAALEQMPGVERIDVVEISSAVVAANEVFSQLNNHALEDERVNLIVDDARHYLKRTQQRYDLIIVGPSYAWVSGTASLFTAEFYSLVKQRLHQDGLMAAWFQLYNIVPEGIKTFAATIDAVFPSATLWASTNFGEVIALASTSKHELDYSLVQQRIKQLTPPSVLRDFMPLDAESVFGHYLMGGSSLKKFIAGAAVNNDDLPLLEFDTPRHLYEWDLLANLRALFAHGVARVPVVNLIRGSGTELSYPFIGLQHHQAVAMARVEFDTRHDISVAAGPQRYLIRQAIFSLPGYQLELRVSDPGHRLGELQLKQFLRQVSGSSQAQVRRIGSDGWYWLARQQEGREYYFMTWYCPQNGLHYLGRLDSITNATALPGVRPLWSELQRQLTCYSPE